VSRVLAAIGATNSADPTLVQAEGRLVPAERLNGERMSAAWRSSRRTRLKRSPSPRGASTLSAGRRRAPTTRQDASDI